MLSLINLALAIFGWIWYNNNCAKR